MFCSLVWFMKYVFSANIWFDKTSTRIVKYKSQVIKSNLVVACIGIWDLFYLFSWKVYPTITLVKLSFFCFVLFFFFDFFWQFAYLILLILSILTSRSNINNVMFVRLVCKNINVTSFVVKKAFFNLIHLRGSISTNINCFILFKKPFGGRSFFSLSGYLKQNFLSWRHFFFVIVVLTA